MFAAVTRQMANEQKTANTDKTGLPIKWFQVCAETRHSPWGLEIFCPQCVTKMVEGNMVLKRFTLDIHQKRNYHKLTCTECKAKANLRRPGFWTFERHDMMLMEYPQPELNLEWKMAGEQDSTDKSPMREEGKAKKRKLS